MPQNYRCGCYVRNHNQRYEAEAETDRSTDTGTGMHVDTNADTNIGTGAPSDQYDVTDTGLLKQGKMQRTHM